MSGVNKVIILGNLGADPEVRFLPSGGSVANLSIATSETWKDKQTGEQKSKVEWHRVVIFGKLAEIAGEYLKKGSKVYIEGALQTRKWQNQQGQEQYTTEIVLQGFGGKMEMLSSNPNAQSGGHQQAPQQASAQQGGGFQQQAAPQQGGGFQQQATQQQQSGFQQQPAQQGGGFQQQSHQQQAKVQPQEPTIDFDSDIPF